MKATTLFLSFFIIIVMTTTAPQKWRSVGKKAVYAAIGGGFFGAGEALISKTVKDEKENKIEIYANKPIELPVKETDQNHNNISLWIIGSTGSIFSLVGLFFMGKIYCLQNKEESRRTQE